MHKNCLQEVTAREIHNLAI
jgi:hypothetical protein